MKVRTAVASCLAEAGCEVIYSVLGGGNMYMAYELVMNHAVRHVAAAREDGAVLMASAYAAVTGRLALATVTYGPGMTNTITALTSAARARIPMIVLTGDAPGASPVDERQGMQLINHSSLIAPTGAGYQVIQSAATAMQDTSTAIRRAIHERRPIVLGVPTDIQKLDVEEAEPGPVVVPASQAVRPDPAAMDRAVGLLASANRPIVLAGRGAVDSGARDELLTLAQRLGSPVATTLLGRELFRDEPNDLGVFGTLSTSVSGRIIGQADSIIAFGASLNWWTTSGGTLLDGKRVIQCDVDAASIGRARGVDASVIGDAAAIAREITAMLDEIDHEPAKFFTHSMADELASYNPSLEIEDHSTDTSIDLRTFLIRLDEILPRDRTVVVDGGRFIVGALQYVKPPDPRSFVMPLAFGAIGGGLGSAVGAAFATPGRPTVLVCGDGGLMMSLTEFNTAVQHDLDLIVVVMNDGAFGQEYNRFVAEGMDPALSYLAWPELAPVADAFGGCGITVRNIDDMKDLPGKIESRDRPLLIDVKIDCTEKIGFYDS